MNREKIINYKEFGDVRYRKNRNARNLSIRINAKGEIRVSLPSWASYKRAERFLLSKSAWVADRKKRMESRMAGIMNWQAGDRIDLPGTAIQFQQGTSKEIEVKKDLERYIVSLPEGYSTDQIADREKVIAILGSIGKIEAKKILPGRLQDLSEKHQLPFTKITIRKMKSRWGSCSSKNAISLNSALVYLPGELIEYVMLHELVHTVHKNHSSAFWETLESILPDTPLLRKKLNDQPIIA